MEVKLPKLDQIWKFHIQILEPMKTIARAIQIGESSCLLLGPRGTGKSTLIKAAFPEALYIDLLQPDTFRNYLAHPERLSETVLANKEKRIVVIDEVQKAPQLLEVVHSLIEKKLGVQFILTGSSARKLRQAGTNLLAGRLLIKNFHPFMASELNKLFQVNQALEIGMIPLVLDSVEPSNTLHSYVDLYLREEVQMEGLTRNIGNFSRFLEAVSFSHAAVLNISNVARECQIERKLVEAYINILEDLLLCFRLPVFTKRVKRSVVAHPKFFLFDSGVFNILRPGGPLDSPAEKAGQALEGLVAQHLRAWIDYFHPDCSLYYFRTSAGTEVDFVVYGKTQFLAIEVKNSAKVSPQDLRSLLSFGQDYPQASLYFLYRGKEKLLRHGINIMPVEEYLLKMSN